MWDHVLVVLECFLNLIFKRFFFPDVDQFKKSLLNFCYNIAFVFYLFFWFFGLKACGILSPRLGIELALPAVEGEVLSRGQQRSSP